MIWLVVLVLWAIQAATIYYVPASLWLFVPCWALGLALGTFLWWKAHTYAEWAWDPKKGFWRL